MLGAASPYRLIAVVPLGSISSTTKEGSYMYSLDAGSTFKPCKGR